MQLPQLYGSRNAKSTTASRARFLGNSKSHNIKMHNTLIHKVTNHKNLCDEVLQLDGVIRYCGLADLLGTLLAKSYRPGLVPLLPVDETEKYTMQAIQRTGAIQGGSKVGRLQFVIGKYEHLVRATIPVTSERNNKYYLMLSFDLGSDPARIMEAKVLPHVE